MLTDVALKALNQKRKSTRLRTATACMFASCPVARSPFGWITGSTDAARRSIILRARNCGAGKTLAARMLGIVGAVLANVLLGLVGVSLTGWLCYLAAGFIGACILIAVARMVRR